MEINIRQLFLIVLKKLPVILSVGLIFALITLFYTTFMVTPLYTSSAMLSIQASENRGDYKSVTSADYTVSVELVSTISELIKNEACLAIVGKISQLDRYYSLSQLKSMVSLSSKGTENFNINVSCPNPEHSLLLVNAFADVISDSSFINGNIVNADEKDPNRGYIKKILKAGTVTLISGAKSVPISPSSPSPKKNTALGFIVGFILSAAFFIVKDAFTNKILTEEDIDALLPGLPALGSIPLIENYQKGSAPRC
ncbi:MAG: hypothetical protein IJD97_04480 [Clostridia bacterium]|nr:hypothetical protein [Clostridia bacterium]